MRRILINNADSLDAVLTALCGKQIN